MPQLAAPKPKPSFPPVPEFYGQQLGPHASPETATNYADWSNQYRKSVPATKPLLEVLMEIADDPRNAWMGLGPAAGMVKGARLIKPLVTADQAGRMYQPTLPATKKALKWSGSEEVAKILDFDPQLGHTRNPLFPVTKAEGFASQATGEPPVTPEEIAAAQEILKKIAQQNAPDTVQLFRGGLPLNLLPPGAAARAPGTVPIPVTSDIRTATEFADRAGFINPHMKPLFELNVPREDLLANIDKLQRGRGYKESEYLIPLRAFQGAQLRIPFPNPSPTSSSTYFPGAKRTRQ